jgi:hypothetical protein
VSNHVAAYCTFEQSEEKMAVGVGGHGEPPGHDVISSMTDRGRGAPVARGHRDERIIAYASGLCIPAGPR